VTICSWLGAVILKRSSSSAHETLDAVGLGAPRYLHAIFTYFAEPGANMAF
jgi:hypothetical protein